VRVVVAAPYLEGTCRAITGELNDRGSLDVFLTGAAWPNLKAWQRSVFSRSGSPGKRLQSLYARKELSWLPAARIGRIGFRYELLQVILRRSRRTQGIASAAMYRGKGSFDRSVAASLRPGGADVVIGMAGSSECTFRRASSLGMMTVLNMTNSHPEVQNRILGEHAHLQEDHHEMMKPRVARRVFREIVLADHVLVPSQVVRQQLLERGLAPFKVTVHPYGADTSRFRGSSRERSSRRGGSLQVVHVGQVSYRKGIRTLIDVARRLPDVDFTLVGPVTDRALVRGLPQNVRLVGPLANSELPGVLSRCDVAVMPTLEDAFGIAAIEVMAASLPIVISSSAGAADFVEHGLSGYVIEPEDANALLHHLQFLRDNRALAATMGDHARRSICEQDLTWAAYGRRVAESLHEWSTS